MKRLISFLLVAAMMFTFMAPAAFAAGTPYVSVGGASANPGDIVKVIVSLEPNGNGYLGGKVVLSADTGLILQDLEVSNSYAGITVPNLNAGTVSFMTATPVTTSLSVIATYQVAADAKSGDYKVYGSVIDLKDVNLSTMAVTSGFGIVKIHSHTWGNYLSDRDGHWQKCSCGETTAKAPHVPGAAPTVDSAQTCTLCGYELSPKLPAPHEHVWGEWIPVDAVQHKRICASDASHVDYASHNFVDNVCTDCGYELDVIIPDDPDIPDDDGLTAQELMLLMMLLRNHTTTITATAGEGGWISPAGATKVGFAGTQTYTITPKIGYVIESVVVDGKDKGAITEYTFSRVITKHTISVTFKKLAWVNPFSDVAESDWFYNDVACANHLGLMIGTSDTTFSPYDVATRAQVITTLWRLDNEPKAEIENPFTDVAEDMYYTEAVLWAAANGIVEGHGDGTFGPDDPITREQIVAIMHRYAEYKGLGVEAEESLAEDIVCSEWAVENIRWAIENNIFRGIGIEIKDMTAKANRAEIAAYLTRLCLYVIAK